jgi:hypothetical protein
MTSTQDNRPSIIKALAALNLLHEHGERIEIRTLVPRPGEVDAPGPSLVGTNFIELATFAKEQSERGRNVFHTIHPIIPEAQLSHAGDEHIQQLRHLILDLDPTRFDAEGNPYKRQSMPATDVELASSLEMSEGICDFFQSTFGVKPTLTRHGNGGCVYVPIQLPTEDSILIKELLAVLNEKFKTVHAHIDGSMFNPSRICRLPGTINRKGEATAERPHRMAAILREGNRDRLLTVDDIRGMLPEKIQVTPARPPMFATRTASNGIDGRVWIEGFLEHHGILNHGEEKYSGSGKKFESRWVLNTAVEDYCPNQDNHSTGNNDSVQAIFLLAGDGGFGFKCHHGGCVDIHWREFRDYHDALAEADGRGKFRTEVPEDGKPEMVIAAGNLNQNIIASENVLSGTHSLNYYQRGSSLVKPVQRGKRAVESLSRADESVVVQPVSTHVLIRDVNAHLQCVRQYANAKAPGGFTTSAASCTTEIAAHLLDRVKMGEANYRSLYTVTTSPVMLPDFSILDRPGWRDGVLFVGGGPDYPIVPENPTQADAIAALQKFESVFAGFPFVGEETEPALKTASYAVLLSGILSLVARPALKTVPLFAVNAVAPGTGKTEAICAAVVSALGYKPTTISYHGPEEFSKALVPALMEADRAINIDNVSIPIAGDMFCSVLTSEEHRARRLGESKHIRLTNKAVFWASGNNLAIQGDLTRRAMMVNLDANCERPEARRFDFNPTERAKKLHPELVIAALTALRAYVLAGKP